MSFGDNDHLLLNDFLLFDSDSNHLLTPSSSSSSFTPQPQPQSSNDHELNKLLQSHDLISALLNTSHFEALQLPPYSEENLTAFDNAIKNTLSPLSSCQPTPLFTNPSTFSSGQTTPLFTHPSTVDTERTLPSAAPKDHFESFVDLSQCSAYPTPFDTPFDTPQCTPYLDTPSLDDFDAYQAYSSFPLFDETYPSHNISPLWYDDMDTERGVANPSSERATPSQALITQEDSPNTLADTSATFLPPSEIPKEVAVSVSSRSGPRKASAPRRGGGPIRKWACDFPGCDRVFARHFNLRSHKGTHYPELAKSFLCERCDKNFTRKHDLTRHSASVHRGERQFSCEGCSRNFSRKDALQRHLAMNGCEDP